MRWRAARALVAISLGASASMFALARPAPAQRTDSLPLPVPGAASAVSPGSNLQIYVMTMGQGDLVWERFGHNALGVRDLAAGTDIVYNWGTFSFEQPGFLGRFLRGEMLYWMTPNDAALTAEEYRRSNRSVTIQELNLTPSQRLEVQQFVIWNARDENKFYRYDYYRDNCSTRVRDAIDRVLGGVIEGATKPQVTDQSYRDHSLRLMDGMFWTRTGIDFGLGMPTDRPITAWEAMFIPMEVQRRVRDIRVPDESGQLVPLVASEREIVSSSRPAELMIPSSHVPGFLLAGLALAAVLLIAGLRARRTFGIRAFTLSWGVVAGIFGLVVFLLWTATEHGAAYRNQNLFFVNPLWLVLAAAIPFVGRGPGARRVAVFAIRACAVLSVIGAAIALTPMGQGTGAIAAFIVPVNLAVYALVVRVIHEAQMARPTAWGARSESSALGARSDSSA